MELNIKVIKDSFEQAKPIGTEVVSKFYEYLFEDYPDSKSLFRNTNMRGQEKALLHSLSFIVENLERKSELIPYLEKMGSRHNEYGVEDIHYEIVGDTLIKTFSFFFGEAWTDDLQEQWRLAYKLIRDTMISGVGVKAFPREDEGVILEEKIEDLKSLNILEENKEGDKKEKEKVFKIQEKNAKDSKISLREKAKTICISLLEDVLNEAVKEALDEKFKEGLREKVYAAIAEVLDEEAESLFNKVA